MTHSWSSAHRQMIVGTVYASSMAMQDPLLLLIIAQGLTAATKETNQTCFLLVTYWPVAPTVLIQIWNLNFCLCDPFLALYHGPDPPIGTGGSAQQLARHREISTARYIQSIIAGASTLPVGRSSGGKSCCWMSPY